MTVSLRSRCLLASFTPGLLLVALLHLFPIAPAHAQSTPQIHSDYTCHPGSENPVYGMDFASSIYVTVSINAQPVGMVSTEDDGDLFFIIKVPAIALSGTYNVAVSTAVSATTVVTDTFGVSYDAPTCVTVRGFDENGNLIEPQSVLLPDWAHHQFLPLVGR